MPRPWQEQARKRKAEKRTKDDAQACRVELAANELSATLSELTRCDAIYERYHALLVEYKRLGGPDRMRQISAEQESCDNWNKRAQRIWKRNADPRIHVHFESTPIIPRRTYRPTLSSAPHPRLQHTRVIDVKRYIRSPSRHPGTKCDPNFDQKPIIHFDQVYASGAGAMHSWIDVNVDPILDSDAESWLPRGVSSSDVTRFSLTAETCHPRNVAWYEKQIRWLERAIQKIA